MTKIYCLVCKAYTKMVIEPMVQDMLNKDKIWGDLVCGKCNFVITTIEVDESGTYEFKRVET